MTLEMAPKTAAGADQMVDPEIATFVRAINESYAKVENIAAMTLPERRVLAEEIRKPWRTGGPEMHETVDIEVSGVRLRIYRPTAETGLPAMLYIHGGGWTLFSIETHDRLMREYAARAGVIVVGIDYSLAPEAKFPTALEEVYAAVLWMRESGGAHGIDTDRIAIGGDSAGANLSVATCLLMREKESRPLSGMLLNYGAYGCEHGPSYVRFDGPEYTLGAEEMDWFWDSYLRGDEDRRNPLAAPIGADLSGLPPVFMAVAEYDILADGNHDMAEKFGQYGVATRVEIYPRATHSFLEAMSVSAVANRAIADGAAWLAANLAQG
ncbi:alpha/beta hydrolase [Parasphingorhabdus sp.]|uniref:alpha/beta hydrolase n=1 Tax=Parasphingorhabdus sp. TaxID=2709688 RepID=UPI003000FE92